MSRVAYLDQPTLFVSGPAEFLVAKVAEKIAAVTQFANVFGSRIEPYLRMDYGIRELPALRIYNDGWTKEHETWYIVGDVVLDVILPPSTRRNLLQQYSDTITAALCQQFRRPQFFTAMAADVPGLNELGKTFVVDKTLSLKFEGGEAPVCQIRANFRILLNDWDSYLTSTDRTVDDPFTATLGNLERLTSTIEGILDDGTVKVSIGSDQEIEGED